MKLLRDEPSFELALARAAEAPFTEGDRDDLQRAVLDTFVAMDREIIRVDHDINIYKVQDFVFRFWRSPANDQEAGYHFTLNQDLLPERKYYNEHVMGARPAVLPGLARKANVRLFGPDIPRFSDDMLMSPVADLTGVRLKGQMNIIKLHGSFNWRADDGTNVMIVGAGKAGRIAATPLLSWYADVFKQVLTAGGVRLVTAGYGFGDEHINSVIADAVERDGLEVFVWNTASDVRRLITSAPHGSRIWNGVTGVSQRALSEVCPGNQADTEEYRRIVQEVFG
ncbi:MAG: SIR2 family protein [Hyphomonadaceae bacterium]